MKLAKFFKTIVISICLVAILLISGIFLTACNDEPDKKKEQEQTKDAIISFLENAKSIKNYTSISEYSNNPTYSYYADVDKIKIEYNGTTNYGIIEDRCMYKISQDDDLLWHKNIDVKNNDVYDLSTPEERISDLISRINATSWNDYDSKTNTLICRLDDGHATAKIDSDTVIVNLIMNTGSTTTFTIKEVGSTTVTLPEDIIDDTLN